MALGSNVPNERIALSSSEETSNGMTTGACTSGAHDSSPDVEKGTQCDPNGSDGELKDVRTITGFRVCPYTAKTYLVRRDLTCLVVPIHIKHTHRYFCLCPRQHHRSKHRSRTWRTHSVRQHTDDENSGYRQQIRCCLRLTMALSRVRPKPNRHSLFLAHLYKLDS
jgi:hypothetical protein